MGGEDLYKKITLDNGVRVVMEKIPHVRSVSIGIWIGTGSRNENRTNNGISHFIEHMLFKGTRHRSARDIARSIDNIGGQLNAFTGKECTCYYTKTLDSHIDIAVELLADMFFNSKFAKRDIDVERKVIIEEIGMYEDSPEELVHDILLETVWGNNSLGYPILGTQECLKTFNRDVIIDYIGRSYIPGNVVVAVAGNYDEGKLLELVNRYFGNWKSNAGYSVMDEDIVFSANTRVKEKDTEQVHICLGFDGIEQGKDELYTLLAINNILGGGMSSRLFQKIREEMGLVYSIYSYPSAYKNAGLFTVYAGMNPEQLTKVIRLIIGEIKELLRDGLENEDLRMSKEQLKGNYILGLESTSSRMNSIGKSELTLGRIFTPEQVLEKMDRIEMESVRNVMEKVFNLEKMSLSAVGNIKRDIDLNTIL